MRPLVVALFLCAVPSVALAQPAGGEFRVNTYTTGFQRGAAVAMDANGDFVVVWESEGQDGSDSAVMGQRFRSDGTPAGGEFRVNTYVFSYQNAPSVAMAASGSFVVVWQSFGQDSSTYGIFGQRFDAAGVPLGGEFLVNSYLPYTQMHPNVAADPAGDFVVVWESNNQDEVGISVFGQVFDAAGSPVGSEFRLNTYTTNTQSDARVSLDADGNFVTVWQSYAEDGSNYGIFAQRYHSSGTPVGGAFRVNTYTTNSQVSPVGARAANGDFVVAWHGIAGGTFDSEVSAQRFNGGGAPVGGQFRVNTFTTNGQAYPSVAMAANGSFVAVWYGFDQDGSQRGIFGRQYGPVAPVGVEFRVNTYTTVEQLDPAVASNADGDFVVVWRSLGQDGSSYGAFGQRFGDLIFKDGLESGGFGRWTAASTDGGDLSVSAAAAMGGTALGLQAVVDDTNPLYVQDDTPAGEPRYRVRLYLDPNGYDPGVAQSHLRTRILIAFDGSGRRALTLVLRRLNGTYGVMARVRRDDGTRADTGFFTISDAPHLIEVDWRRSDPGLGNGSVQLFIDDVSITVLGGIENDATAIESARLGALAVKTGAAGTLRYDQFESRRLRYVGPE